MGTKPYNHDGIRQQRKTSSSDAPALHIHGTGDNAVIFLNGQKLTKRSCGEKFNLYLIIAKKVLALAAGGRIFSCVASTMFNDIYFKVSKPRRVSVKDVPELMESTVRPILLPEGEKHTDEQLLLYRVLADSLLKRLKQEGKKRVNREALLEQFDKVTQTHGFHAEQDKLQEARTVLEMALSDYHAYKPGMKDNFIQARVECAAIDLLRGKSRRDYTSDKKVVSLDGDDGGKGAIQVVDGRLQPDGEMAWHDDVKVWKARLSDEEMGYVEDILDGYTGKERAAKRGISPDDEAKMLKKLEYKVLKLYHRGRLPKLGRK